VVLTSTIAISRNTRDLLKTLGKKGDTYDELIRQLVDIKRKNRNQEPLDRRLETLQSSESEGP
jgi:predicted CopG family antitoxin